VVDLTVFDEVADPDLLVIPPLTVVASEPMRLGAAVAAMVLERLDGLAGPARDVVLPALFQHPQSTAVRLPGDAKVLAYSRRRAFGDATPIRARTVRESR
jgi:hypothetical protein